MAKVLISIDDALLRSADQRAAQLQVSRSEFVSSLIRAQLGSADRAAARRRSALSSAREACAAAARDHEDTTAWIRRMRDAR